MGDRHYRVTLPFHSPHVKLPAQIELSANAPMSAIVEQGEDYVATLDVSAPSANEALRAGREVVEQFLWLLGAKGQLFTLGSEEETTVTAVDRKPVSPDEPLPHLDVIGGMFSELGENWIDPTGELRRQGKIV